MKRIKLIAAALSLTIMASMSACAGKTEETTTAATSAETTVASEEDTSAITEETTTEPSETTTESSTTETEKRATEADLEKYETFEVTSEDLKDGVWADVISNDQGDNVSPQLSWESVEGAGLYVIYMVDPDGGNWIHWKSDAVTETTLPQGWASSTEYVGPYPPSGSTHQYDIYVVALKAPVERMSGNFNNSNSNFFTFMMRLDTDAEGNSGNIISYGKISGTYTSP